MAEIRTTSSTGGQKGVKLARFDLIPVGPLTELAEHYGRGARKYASHQWRQGYEWSKSYAAMCRHQNLFWGGEDYDVCSNDPNGCSFVTDDGEPFEPTEPDTCYNHTGSHHMVAVAWHAFGLLEFKDVNPEHDDRYKVERADLVDEEREPAYYYSVADRILRGEIQRQSPEPVVITSPDLDGNVAAEDPDAWRDEWNDVGWGNAVVEWGRPAVMSIDLQQVSRKTIEIMCGLPRHRAEPIRHGPHGGICTQIHNIGDCPNDVYFSAPQHRLDSVGGAE